MTGYGCFCMERVRESNKIRRNIFFCCICFAYHSPIFVYFFSFCFYLKTELKEQIQASYEPVVGPNLSNSSSPKANKFQFSPVTEYDVYSCLLKLKSDTIGDDQIPLRFVKIILPYVLYPLTHIINNCFTTSTFPTQWKVGLVIPVEKNSSPVDKNDYRPITILPCLSKVCEKLIEQQMVEFFTEKKFFSQYQSGFRARHSCATAIMKIIDDILHFYDNNELILLCLLDFSKAFDSIVHRFLLDKLKTLYDFSASAVALISSYLSERCQKVKVGNNVSNSRGITRGVPQGSILGPLLFGIYLNDLFSTCENVAMHGYADDIQIYLSRPPSLVEDVCYRLNEDLHKISVWASQNGLSLNAGKSCVLPISRNNVSIEDLPSISLNNSNLKFVDKIKNLGFTLNSQLTANDHISQVVNKIYFTLRTLRLSANYTPEDVRKMLALQLLMPIVSYAETVFCKIDSVAMHKLLVAFNHIVWYVYGLKNYEHVSAKKKEFIGMDLQEYFDMRNCIFLHKIIYDQTPM